MHRSPADERAVIKERLEQAQQGLLNSKTFGASQVDEGISLPLVSCSHFMFYLE